MATGLLVAACGADKDGDADWESGSRLRARVFASADGARQFLGWHDSAQDEDCGFTRVADGALRCLPTDAVFAELFADSTCAFPMMPASPECGPSPYAWHREAQCDAGYTFHRRGARLDPQPARLYARGVDGRCIGGWQPEPGVEYFALEPAVDPRNFVAAELVPEDNGPLRNQRLVAGDGARQLTGAALDPQTGLRMYPGDPGDGVGRWFPAFHRAGWFADEACTSPLGCVSTDVGCGLPEVRAPYVAEPVFTPGCGATGFVVREVRDTAATPVAWSNAEACTPAEPTEPLACFVVGDIVPLDRFPEVTEIASPGERIRARHQGVEGGGAVSPSWFLFHDDELDLHCYPLTAADGELRCLPSFFIPYANLFSDAGCTVPGGYYHQASHDPCYPTPPVPALVAWREPDTTPCVGGHFSDAVRRTYRLGAPLSVEQQTALFVVAPEGCVPVAPALLDGPPFAITEMAPDQFIAVARRVE